MLEELSEVLGWEILGIPEDGAHSGQAHGLGPDHSHPARGGTPGGGPEVGRSQVKPKEYLKMRIKPLRKITL